MSQRPGERHTSYRVSSQPERARHTLCLISQGDGIHYPVGHPLLGDSIPFLPASVTDKSWSKVLRLRVLSTYRVNAWTGQAKLGLGLPPPGAALAGSPLGPRREKWEPLAHRWGLRIIWESAGPNFRHESSTENACRSPTLLMEVSASRSRVFIL